MRQGRQKRGQLVQRDRDQQGRCPFTPTRKPEIARTAEIATVIATQRLGTGCDRMKAVSWCGWVSPWETGLLGSERERL
jgi:hypothetical protein